MQQRKEVSNPAKVRQKLEAHGQARIDRWTPVIKYIPNFIIHLLKIARRSRLLDGLLVSMHPKNLLINPHSDAASASAGAAGAWDCSAK